MYSVGCEVCYAEMKRGEWRRRVERRGEEMEAERGKKGEGGGRA